jgi:hypothetical protein
LQIKLLKIVSKPKEIFEGCRISSGSRPIERTRAGFRVAEIYQKGTSSLRFCDIKFTAPLTYYELK